MILNQEMSLLTNNHLLFCPTLPDYPYWEYIPSYGFGGYRYQTVTVKNGAYCSTECGSDERCRSANDRFLYPSGRYCELNSKALGDDAHAYNLTYERYKVIYYHWCIIEGKYIHNNPKTHVVHRELKNYIRTIIS